MMPQAATREGEVPYRPLPPHLMYLDRKGWDAIIAGRKAVVFMPFAHLTAHRAWMRAAGPDRCLPRP